MKKPASMGLGPVGLEMCSEEGAAHVWSPNTPHLFALWVWMELRQLRYPVACQVLVTPSPEADLDEKIPGANL